MPKPKRGLAALPPERRKEIARKGNKALREKGKSHTYTKVAATHAANKRWTTQADLDKLKEDLERKITEATIVTERRASRSTGDFFIDG